MALRCSLTGVRAVLFKIAADQLTLMPGFVVLFFVYQALLEGETLSQAVDRTTTAFLPTVVRCGMYYSCVHVVTFGLLPTKYRFAWSSMMAVGWTAYISYANQELIKEEQKEGRGDNSVNSDVQRRLV